MADSVSPCRKTRLVVCALIAVGAAWCATDWYVALPIAAKAAFVGRESCVACHAEQARTWHGSDHDRAMEVATAETVLGDFDDTQFTRFGVTTRFFRRDGKYFFNTEGPDGQFHDYEVKYTFGIDPMQQYMAEFPDGRVQVLSISWDTRRQEWFFVTPPDVTDERILPGDPLHWTGLAQNWNSMCAECHSTDLQKNYDLASDSYHTKFTDIDVSCEACHGPGSLHVELAESHSLFWDRRRGYALATLKGASAEAQAETCAPCHSRRSPLYPDWHRGEQFLDRYHPSLIEAGLYHADGQILDEVYEYGSFLQSKMFSKGIRCTDCHDPHSLELKYEGNQLCAQCHLPGKYDSPSHHHHTDFAATQCVNCHMPTRNYMVIDARHDHSLRVPRPDLSEQLGTPNACNGCHTKPEESPTWAAAKVREWYGDQRPDDPHFGLALGAAQQGRPEGLELIRELLRRGTTPEIIRATAVRLLAQYGIADSDRLCRESLHHTSPLVRAAACEAISENGLAQHTDEVADLLADPVRLVRVSAARRLVHFPRERLVPSVQRTLSQVLDEYREGQEFTLERAASHLNLAALADALGDEQSAWVSLGNAIRLEPYLTGPREQLAGLVEQAGGDAAEVRRLREEELGLLERDAKLLPTSSAIPYRRGMLLYLLQRPADAREALEKACELAPDSYDNWLALALICEHQRAWQQAVAALVRMQELRPDDPAAPAIMQRIQQTRSRNGEK